MIRGQTLRASQAAEWQVISLQCRRPGFDTWIRTLGWEDPLEKEMATHSSILAWKIPWTEEPDRLQFMGSQRVGHYQVTFTYQ